MDASCWGDLGLYHHESLGRHREETLQRHCMSSLSSFWRLHHLRYGRVWRGDPWGLTAGALISNCHCHCRCLSCLLRLQVVPCAHIRANKMRANVQQLLCKWAHLVLAWSWIAKRSTRLLELRFHIAFWKVLGATRLKSPQRWEVSDTMLPCSCCLQFSEQSTRSRGQLLNAKLQSSVKPCNVLMHLCLGKASVGHVTRRISPDHTHPIKSMVFLVCFWINPVSKTIPSCLGVSPQSFCCWDGSTVGRLTHRLNPLKVWHWQKKSNIHAQYLPVGLLVALEDRRPLWKQRGDTGRP